MEVILNIWDQILCIICFDLFSKQSHEHLAAIIE